MDINSAIEIAQELRRQVWRHDHLYYGLDAPEISDQGYDDLMRRLGEIEREHPAALDPESPTQRVGGAVASHLPEAIHGTPMLSLGNVNSADEFREWYERTLDRLAMHMLPMNAEPKIDGLAIRLIYNNGRFTQAVTRGNGVSGEDVTHNVRTIRGIPLELDVLRNEDPPELLEVRGEVYMPRTAFLEANEDREQQGEQPFANPRNAAAGTVRQLDPGLASRRGLRAWVYQNQSPATNSHRLSLRDLERMGLPVNPRSRLCWDPAEVWAFREEMLADREMLDYEIDGIVVKLDHFSLHEILGATSHEPRWAVAWKFPAGRAETLLREIRLSHGRFGRLTPVAVLDPVEVGGVTVQSASLHNLEDIRRKDIRPGARVIVERAGDVIPQVAGPARGAAANSGLDTFEMPRECPACQTPVETRRDEVGHWCPNGDCSALLPEQLLSLVGKDAMDIDGLGEHWCTELVRRGMLRNTADIYRLKREELLKLDRMGERLADRILGNIDASRQQPLERALYALGIHRLGRRVSKLLAANFAHVDEIVLLERDELAGLDGIGPVVADCVHTGLRLERVRRTLEIMKEVGVNLAGHPDRREDKMSTNGKLAGKTIVVTGKLEGMTRIDAEDIIRAHGGKASSAVTRSTDYLVVGEKPGSKLNKARQFGVIVLEQNEFQELLEG